MMITLEKLTWDRGKHTATTTPISINPKYVVSVSAGSKPLHEVNGSRVDNLHITEINYMLGSEVEKIFVIGEQGEVSRRLFPNSPKRTRGMLYG